jgi:hypothetical protein
MENQLDGRAVAHALRGLADVAPAPGDLPAILQQLVDTAKTVLAADGIGLLLADANGQPGSLVTTDAVAELLEQVQQDFGEGPASGRWPVSQCGWVGWWWVPWMPMPRPPGPGPLRS